MSDLIERGCRAMCADAGFNPDEVMPSGGPRWVYYKPSFIAAIKAMRDPTDEMRAAVGANWGRRTWAEFGEVIDVGLGEHK